MTRFEMLSAAESMQVKQIEANDSEHLISGCIQTRVKSSQIISGCRMKLKAASITCAVALSHAKLIHSVEMTACLAVYMHDLMQLCK